MHDLLLYKIRQETKDEFNDFHRKGREGLSTNSDIGDEAMFECMNPFPQNLHVGDIIQYNRIGFVSGKFPLVTSCVLEVSVEKRKYSIGLCNSQMLPDDYQVMKIYEFTNNKLVKIENPKFLDLSDYNISSEDELLQEYIPKTYAKLIQADVSSSVDRLCDKLSSSNHGTELVTKLFSPKAVGSKRNRINFDGVDPICFHNCIDFTKDFEILDFDSRVALVHGMRTFLDYVAPNSNNNIVEFIEGLSNKLIMRKKTNTRVHH